MSLKYEPSCRHRPYLCDLQGTIDSVRGTARAEDAQGTPTQSHISPRILVYEDYMRLRCNSLSLFGLGEARLFSAPKLTGASRRLGVST